MFNTSLFIMINSYKHPECPKIEDILEILQLSIINKKYISEYFLMLRKWSWTIVYEEIKMQYLRTLTRLNIIHALEKGLGKIQQNANKIYFYA